MSFLSIILVKSIRNQEMWASGSPQDRKWLYKQPVMLSVGPRAVGFPNPTLKIILGKVLFKCFKMSYSIFKAVILKSAKIKRNYFVSVCSVGSSCIQGFFHSAEERGTGKRDRENRVKPTEKSGTILWWFCT